jgi:type III secretion protein C
MTWAWTAAGAAAATIVWKKTRYSHYAQNEDLKEILVDFFAAQGIGIVCSEHVKGKISGDFVNQDPQAFFDQITDAYNLIWYYDGAAVYLYSGHEMTSHILNLGYLDMKRFKQNLRQLDILDDKFAFRLIEKDRVVYVSGPERYVQLVSDLAEQLDAKAMARRGRDDIISVFPLKYAWADDKSLVFRDRQMTIPGVATLLATLLTGNTTPGMVSGKDEHLSKALSKLKGKGLAKTRSPKDDKDALEVERQNGPDAKDPPAFVDTDFGFVQADPRQNAVVVRDREEKMPFYKQIIELLDVPVGLVEIRATIIDVDRDTLQELGIQWEFAASNDDGDRVVKGGFDTTEAFDDENGLQMPLGQGLNVATIIGDAADYFLAKVRALQKKGHAKILSRPSVLTLNNMEAQLEHTRTFYVRVAGDQEVDLYDINAGVVLRVTPHIIHEKSRSMIKMAIQIEDGELLEETVDDIPVVKKSTINTQAVVAENDSLLIGGYLKERNIRTQQQVPCLGDIPLLGWLFRNRTTSGSEFERLFLISPTIVGQNWGKTKKLTGSDSETLETLTNKGD